LLALIVVTTPAGPAATSTPTSWVSQSLSFRTTDGTVLHATVAGDGSLTPRPLIIEDSPYAPDVSTLEWVGSDFNVMELQWRGTGLSGGSLDSAGALDQRDLSQFLGWACTQPWGNGTIGLYGFSASAIVVYNAMHLPLPCVKTAALMAGSTDLYRDLLDIGGIPNIAAGIYVEAAIGGATLTDGGTRFETEPGTIPAATEGYPISALAVASNVTDDAFWQERSFRGDLDQIPFLADTSFYDVEPDGPFAAFEATQQYGSHLLVMGAHDGFPAGTPGPFPQYRNWFEHALAGQVLSTANQPVVSAYLSNGNRQQFLDGNVTQLTDSTWPLAGTTWTSLYLSSATNSTVTSLNQGSLSTRAPSTEATQLYPFVPSEPSETDLHNTSVVDTQLDELAGVPGVNDTTLSDPTSLTYTSPPLAQNLTVAGPGAVDLWVSSVAPVTDLYIVVADVWPDGTAYPIGTGALRTSFPKVDSSRSLVENGRIVDPYNDYSTQSDALPGQKREYQVEIMPMGNVFAAGSRIRVYVLGTPVDQLASPPGVNAVSLGGLTPSQLLLPSVGVAPQFGS
jgi:predicted acyl esterase